MAKSQLVKIGGEHGNTYITLKRIEDSLICQPDSFIIKLKVVTKLDAEHETAIKFWNVSNDDIDNLIAALESIKR